MIYDIAENAKNEVVRLNLPSSRDFVLAILCSESHIEKGAAVGTPLTQVSEDMSEINAFPL